MTLENDGPVNLIDPFEKLGRRITRRWTPSHVSAASLGQRSNYPRDVHKEAWRTLYELSRYAREGVLPLYPCDRVAASERISPSLVWLIYPLYPTRNPSARGRGIVHLVDGEMIEAVADITEFRKVIQSDHPAFAQMGRPLLYPEYYYAAKAFWDANAGKVKTGVVIQHIKTHKPKIHASVPSSTRYRLVERARVDAHKVA